MSNDGCNCPVCAPTILNKHFGVKGASTTLTNVDVVNVGATFTSLGWEGGGWYGGSSCTTLTNQGDRRRAGAPLTKPGVTGGAGSTLTDSEVVIHLQQILNSTLLGWQVLHSPTSGCTR